jgi:hypothetical protein
MMAVRGYVYLAGDPLQEIWRIVFLSPGDPVEELDDPRHLKDLPGAVMLKLDDPEIISRLNFDRFNTAQPDTEFDIAAHITDLEQIALTAGADEKAAAERELTEIKASQDAVVVAGVALAEDVP